jgi:hypothetical protein
LWRFCRPRSAVNILDTVTSSAIPGGRFCILSGVGGNGVGIVEVYAVP